MTQAAPSDVNGCFFGIDIGSTTSSLLVASARIIRNAVTGRSELADVRLLFQPQPIFTPFAGETLEIPALARQIDAWLAAATRDVAQLDPSSIVAGGALITGLAARAANAEAVAQLVRGKFPDTVVARADDPCLESWLAFMGNTLGLSRAEPERAFVNLDIGGGTTNIAWGTAGEVRHCGSLFVGARHFQIEAGTYRLTALSGFARELLAGLGLPATIGSDLSPGTRTAVLDFFIAMLEAAVGGREWPAPADVARRLRQVEMVPPPRSSDSAHQRPIVTLSGGVGELAYRCARGEELPATTAFGDLGIDLARRLCASPILGGDLTTHVPAALGRATVYGLTLHSAEISGATLYLPRPEMLPLVDLPILGSISAESTAEELEALVALAARGTTGACLRVRGPLPDAASVKALGERLADAIEKSAFPGGLPLVLLVGGNIGKTLGQYTTRWGRLPLSLVVLDELPDRPAHFASIGRPCQNLIPVAFHGWGGAME